MSINKRMTKAERLFKDTRYMCYKHIKDWGVIKQENSDELVGFNSLDKKENDIIYPYTIKEVEKQLNNAYRDLELKKKYNIIETDYYQNELHILDMIKVTIKNEEKHMSV